MITPSREIFRELAGLGNAIPLVRQLMSDQFTPVLAYRRLVSADERTAPSFLFESVEDGAAVGRHSFVGAQPAMEVVAFGNEVTITDHRTGGVTRSNEDDPLAVLRRLAAVWRPAAMPGSGPAPGPPLPGFSGGWVGYAGYEHPDDPFPEIVGGRAACSPPIGLGHPLTSRRPVACGTTCELGGDLQLPCWS